MSASKSLGELFAFRTEQKSNVKQDQPVQHAGHHCPACNHPVSPTADICEACGKWLLEGKCCFCYTPYAYGQKFCSSCGNPPAGITCKSCNTHSYFDICPTCNAPLSKRAGPVMQSIRDSQEMTALQQMIENIGPVAEPENLQDDIKQLAEYLKQAQQLTKKKQQYGFEGPTADKDFSAEMENKVQQPSTQEEDQQKEAMLLQQIAQLQSKLFADNQSARLFYTSIKVMIPSLVRSRRLIGWRCNFANVLHLDGPTHCGGPSEGGEWIYEGHDVWDSVELSGDESATNSQNK